MQHNEALRQSEKTQWKHETMKPGTGPTFAVNVLALKIIPSASWHSGF
jgi:hypothetical protein